MLRRQNIDSQIRMIAKGVGGRLTPCEEWILKHSCRNAEVMRCDKKAMELLNTPEMIRIVSLGKHFGKISRGLDTVM